MHILYVIEQMSRIGGMERITADKINWLARQEGIKVTLMFVWKESKQLAYHIDNSVDICHINAPMVKGGLTYPYVLWKYNSMVKRLKPDITILSWVTGSLLATFGKNSGKVVYESHLVSTHMTHSWLQQSMQDKVDVVVTLTNSDAQNFPKSKRVEVIPNFTLLKTNKGTDYSQKHCIAVGRLVYQKNYPRMIAIWQQIVKQHPDWTLDIYGDGDERQQIEQCIHKYGVEGSVVLHGNTNNVGEAYLSGSILLMTSHMEGLPLVLLEAMTYGIPAVAFDCPTGPRDVITDGVDGRLIPIHDNSSFIKALSQLMGDASLRQQMGEKARENVARFSCESIMQRWMDMFNSLVNDK